MVFFHLSPCSFAAAPVRFSSVRFPVCAPPFHIKFLLHFYWKQRHGMMAATTAAAIGDDLPAERTNGGNLDRLRHPI